MTLVEPFSAETDRSDTDVVLATSRTTAPTLNVSQLRVFDELLAVAGSRPTAPANIGERLREHIDNGVKAALAAWPERSFWFGKSMFTAMAGCEGQVVADAVKRRDNVGTLPVPTAVGIVAHRAIQISNTHADHGYTVDQLVRLAVAGACTEDSFAVFWNTAAAHTQSDVLTRAVSSTLGFLDTFPPLAPVWSPRWEESISAKVGALTMSSRVDLVLGRPKQDGRQTMFLADMKTSDIRDHHFDEAMFYALVATLRHGVPPFRSTVLSVASGDWTDPDVTAERLYTVADQVVTRVNAAVDILTESRPPVLEPSRSCAWCSAKDTCPAVERAVEPTSVTLTPAVSNVDATIASVPIDISAAEAAALAARHTPAALEADSIAMADADVSVDVDDPYAIDD